ncbi:MAG: T9SS C-terminal target domain-containing protein [Candidatus Kapaibacterium sp.]|nr:MAG: T9SS C-terminal target domain-containing protein [Candidatus Kapabacteria bacterium]
MKQFLTRCLFLLTAQILTFQAITAQTYGAGADTVFSVKWGMGQDFGRSNFPANVLGLPDTSARANRPSNNPAQVCSLGMGGEIVLGWKNAMLVNRTGADFSVFENAFLRFDGKVFAEPAKIAVSRDGVRFVEFPFDSLSLQGCAGKTPTNGNESPFNPRVSGGDSFDLATIGMDSIRFVKITDISAIVLNNPRHPFYDPTITGFDVDALVGFSLVPMQPRTSVAMPISSEIIIKTSSDILTIEIPQGLSAQAHSGWSGSLFNAHGASMLDFAPQTFTALSVGHLARGAYFLVVRSEGQYFFRKILLL